MFRRLPDKKQFLLTAEMYNDLNSFNFVHVVGDMRIGHRHENCLPEDAMFALFDAFVRFTVGIRMAQTVLHKLRTPTAREIEDCVGREQIQKMQEWIDDTVPAGTQ